MKQWSMRITAYADRLLKDLDGIDWTESIKEAQRNWIGKSEGTSLRFRLTPNPSPKERGTGPGYQTAKKKMWGSLKENSRANRKTQTEAEEILWEIVRDKKLGYKIRRQHSIDQFIADFVCLEEKLIIEVDGEIHEHQQEYDEGRTYILEDIGYRVIRFTNDSVKNNIDWVTKKIIKALQSSLKQQSTSHAGTPLLWRGEGGEAFIEVFTTRPDTIFGVSFVTLAPEHDLVSVVTTSENKKAVDEYVTTAKNRSERERQADVKKITGVFTGSYVEHPFTGKQVPSWVGDYVLAGYGTGAVMAVPMHDTRDFAFANHFGIPKQMVIQPPVDWDFALNSYDDKAGKLINSDFLNGLEVKEAIKKAIAVIEEKGIGKGKTNFRLRDAIFGRQRYWGEPIPVYYENGIPKVLNENELPLLLPEVDKYLPTETGEPPLARASSSWKKDGKYEYEYSTMPGWAGSSWYYLRYMDAHNDKTFVSKEAVDYWQNVDLYIGGAEHATGHLLYVRFWTKFLNDLGLIPVIEPAKKLINQGMIQGVSAFAYRVKDTNCFISKNRIDSFLSPEELSLTGLKIQQLVVTPIHVDVNIVNNNVLNIDAFRSWREEYKDAEFILEEGKYICGSEVEKMSKSKYNVVSPDLVVQQHGADCLRLYEMFLGPLELSKPWNTNGISGVSNFIRKLWRLYHNGDNLNVSDEPATKPELKALHKTIKKIIFDIENFSFNTSVSNFMICVNELTELKCNKREILEPLAIIIAPYAPHVAEELWNQLGHKDSITYATFPECKEEYLIESAFNYPVSFNGKTRFFQEYDLSLTKEDIEKEVMTLEQTQKYLEGKTPKKIIVVHNKIVNIVI